MTDQNPAYGWRLDRIPGKRVERSGDGGPGGITLPLWILHHGNHQGDGLLRLSSAEAEQLHAELCYALSDAWPARETPACRTDQAGNAVHRP